MTHEGLDGTDFGSGFEQMGREGMAHGVAGHAFGNGGFANRVFHLTLHGGFMEVMTGHASGSWVGTESCGGEKILPWPFSAGVRPFAQKCFGHVDITCANNEVLQMFFPICC